jgi:small-conductance mechanosensitive channel
MSNDLLKRLDQALHFEDWMPVPDDFSKAVPLLRESRNRIEELEALRAVDQRMATKASKDAVSWKKRADQAEAHIEELEAENKLLSEGATIAHLRGAIDAHANRADDIWEAHKHWEGERKFALRQIVRWLKETPGGEAEGE